MSPSPHLLHAFNAILLVRSACSSGGCRAAEREVLVDRADDVVLTLSVGSTTCTFFWIGCNVAKRTASPVITINASAVNVGLNFLLVPHYGMGRGVDHAIGFAILAVLATHSNKWYPIRTSGAA